MLYIVFLKLQSSSLLMVTSALYYYVVSLEALEFAEYSRGRLCRYYSTWYDTYYVVLLVWSVIGLLYFFPYIYKSVQSGTVYKQGQYCEEEVHNQWRGGIGVNVRQSTAKIFKEQCCTKLCITVLGLKFELPTQPRPYIDVGL